MMGVSDQNMTYLDGTLPGDFGFDPLGMSDPEGAGGFVNPQWLAYSEVIHGRWAMLGVAGIVAPEILGGMGIIPESTGLVWFTSGAIPPQGTFDYWASPMTIFWVNMCLMNFAEIKRGQDYWFPGSQAETPLLGWEKGFGGSGKFILIIVWAIKMMSCFVYRQPRVPRRQVVQPAQPRQGRHGLHAEEGGQERPSRHDGVPRLPGAGCRHRRGPVEEHLRPRVQPLRRQHARQLWRHRRLLPVLSGLLGRERA